MAHRERVEVTFGDVDMMGHVNHAAYFTYFETARTNYYLGLKGLRAPWSRDELDLIVARATCDYRRGLSWGERVEVVVWPTKVGQTSFTFGYAIVDEAGAVVALGETVQVSFDYAKQSKKPIPPAVRRALEQEAAAGPGLRLPA
jgi:acyl-CoA thioester hydrolase